MLAAALAGAAGGTIGARALIAAYPFDRNDPRAGWTADPLEASPGSGAILTAIGRAARAQREPARLPPGQSQTLLSAVDSDGRAFDGRSRYVLRFSAPADAFWTLAVLASDDLPPDDGQSALNSNTPDLHRGANGSVEVSIQATSPDDPAANWLATPQGPFRLVLRLFRPPPTQEGQPWRPPLAQRRETTA